MSAVVFRAELSIFKAAIVVCPDMPFNICQSTVLMKNTVKVERAIRNITQQELADAVGVSRQTINFIETGRYMPSTVVALKIARYFGRHADEIFQLEEND